MSLKGPIISVEDDMDDQFLIRQILEGMDVLNEVIFFSNGQEALQFLETTQRQPFLILCDINMPIMNGIELRDHISKSDYLRQKSIPFVFLSTVARPEYVRFAYNTSVQGFYKKGNTYSELQQQLKCIVDYWKHCLHPNNNA